MKYSDPFTNLPQAPQSAIREGDYKLIIDWNGKLHLFNIEKDFSEEHDLSYAMPEKTDELFSKLLKWLKNEIEPSYFPTLNPDFSPTDETHIFPYEELIL